MITAAVERAEGLIAAEMSPTVPAAYFDFHVLPDHPDHPDRLIMKLSTVARALGVDWPYGHLHV